MLEFKGKKKDAMVTLQKDLSFLARHHLIDYSLLVGLSKRDKLPDVLRRETPKLDRALVLRQVTDEHIIYFGIVDILTPYGPRKKIEKWGCFWRPSLLSSHCNSFRLPSHPLPNPFQIYEPVSPSTK
jgi:hypothetical protein